MAGPSPGTSVAGALATLDPWSFWTAPGRRLGVDHLVVGTTGAFAVRTCNDPAAGDGKGGLALKVRGARKLKRAARRLRADLAAVAVYVDAEPIVCYTNTPPFSPRTIRGVRVVPRDLLVREIAERPHVVLASKAKRGGLELRKLAANIR